MLNAEFYSYVAGVALKVFGDSIFKRRQLMVAVEKQLRKDGLWLEKYDQTSRSRGEKSKGLEKIDYAFTPLRKDGRLIHHDHDQWSVSESGPDLDQEFLEGGKVAHYHLKIERDPDAIRSKKMAVIRDKGFLNCEVCGFDFNDKYGDLGKGFIECHHLIPLHSLEGNPGKTTHDGLIIICSNCHRIVHRGLKQSKTLTTLDEIRSALLK